MNETNDNKLSLEIREHLGKFLPAVNFDSDFLFSELDSLGISTILFLLSQKFDILLGASDITPRNFRNLDSLAAMVFSKMSLENKILQYSVQTPDKVAVICGDERLSYSELWNAILERQEQLKAEGLKPHRPYVFRATQDIRFLITYCAVHAIGAVAVPLERSASDDSFGAVSDEVASAQFANDIADTLYTTGTTGKSKGVMLSRTSLIACAQNFIESMQFSQDLLFIISGPLNHIASLFKILPVLSVGATLCILDGLKDLNAFFDVFRLPYSRFATFLVPASMRIIMQFCSRQLCSVAPKIDFIELGAAPVTEADMGEICRMLPTSRLYNTYGGTEIGCVCTYNFNDGRHIEGCVGRPMPNSSVRITPEGNVIVAGKTIMSGYVADADATAAVLRDGCILTSDMGYIDEDGMLHLTGRQGDVINVSGYKVNPVEVENAASSFPGIKESVCIPAEHPVVGTVLKLLVVLADGASLDQHALAEHLKGQLDSYKVPMWYETVPSVRHTYNGKVDRKSYRTE